MTDQVQPAPQPTWDKKFDKPITDALATLRQSVDALEAAALARIAVELRPRLLAAEDSVRELTALVTQLRSEAADDDQLEAKVRETLAKLEAEIDALKAKIQ